MESFTIAKVFILNDGGKLLALRRSKTDTRRPLQWDFPGGFVEPGEDLAAAAIRETDEETGVTITQPALLYGSTEVVTDDIRRSGTWLIFRAWVKGTPDVTLSFEHADYAWFDPVELLQQITYDRQKRMLQYAIDNGLLHGAHYDA